MKGRTCVIKGCDKPAVVGQFACACHLYQKGFSDGTKAQLEYSSHSRRGLIREKKG